MNAMILVAQTAELGTNKREWMLDTIIPLLLAVAVLLLWLGGGKGDTAGVMRRVGEVITALGSCPEPSRNSGLGSPACSAGKIVMCIRTDHEVYRVDSVWLGRHKALRLAQQLTDFSMPKIMISFDCFLLDAGCHKLTRRIA